MLRALEERFAEAQRTYQFIESAYRRAGDRYFDRYHAAIRGELDWESLTSDALLSSELRNQLMRAGEHLKSIAHEIDQATRQRQKERKRADAERRQRERVARQNRETWRDPEPESIPDDVVVALPLPVAEVETIPNATVHVLTDTVHRQSERLVDWNYFSLESSRRRQSSRRYEGYR